MTESSGIAIKLSTLVIGISVLASACGAASEEFVAGPGDLVHVHDMAIGEDGVLLVAAHTGLYRIEGESRAVLVGDHHDLMSMTLLADGDLLASGHPNLLLDEFRVEGRPPLLGLARSGDGGKIWNDLDLLGEADFHALVPYDGGLYAAESGGRIWFNDPETGWTVLGEVEARDLAIDPADAARQLAPDYEGNVWVSGDGAASWTPATMAPELVEIEWPEPTLILGVDEAGRVWAAETPDGGWVEIATGLSGVETLYVDPAGSWWVAVSGGAISRSDDRGNSWVDVYVPPLFE